MDIYPEWMGEVAAVVAGGQSAAAIAPLLAGRCRIIAVNLAFRLVPDADVLYAADGGFWHVYGAETRKFKGLKLSCDDRAQLYDATIGRVYVREGRDQPYQRMRFERRGHIGVVGGNSGAQAVNLAAQFGAAVILLVGLDYQGKHWHADHGNALRNPSPAQLKKWARAFDAEADTLRDYGVRVINLSNTSALRAYPHVDPYSILSRPESATLSA